MKKSFILLSVGLSLLSTYQTFAMLEFFKKTFRPGETEQPSRKPESRLERKQDTVNFWTTVVSALKAQGASSHVISRAQSNLQRAQERLRHPGILFRKRKRVAPPTRRPQRAPRKTKRGTSAEA